jgi:hypothetical protein
MTVASSVVLIMTLSRLRCARCGAVREGAVREGAYDVNTLITTSRLSCAVFEDRVGPTHFINMMHCNIYYELTVASTLHAVLYDVWSGSCSSAYASFSVTEVVQEL